MPTPLKPLKLKLWFLAAGLVIAASLSLHQAAIAQIRPPSQEPPGLSATANYADIPIGSPRVTTVAATIINTAIGVLGVIFVLLFVYAGFLWMTAAGSEEKVGKAKKLLMSGSVGLVIVLGGYGIASFVMTTLRSATDVPLPGVGRTVLESRYCNAPMPDCGGNVLPDCTESGWECPANVCAPPEPTCSSGFAPRCISGSWVCEGGGQSTPCARINENCDVPTGGLLCCAAPAPYTGADVVCLENYNNQSGWTCQVSL